jgi:DNA-binding MarR family transcriptional regulator
MIGETEEFEAAVRKRLNDQPFDLTAMTMVANIYRAATAFRNRVEQDLLARYALSWSGFTALFVLWVWGPTEANRLAADVGVSRPTLTGLMATLADRGFVLREQPPEDRRKRIISLTEFGLRTVEEIFPQFHAHEVDVTRGIPQEVQAQVADALRAVRQASES